MVHADAEDAETRSGHPGSEKIADGHCTVLCDCGWQGIPSEMLYEERCPVCLGDPEETLTMVFDTDAA